MNAIFKKLNFKSQPAIYILGAPVSFHSVMEDMQELTQIHTDLGKAKSIAFLVAFVIKRNEVDQLAGRIARQSIEDAIVWIAYPKGSSKKLKCDFNRDNGWSMMGANGFEPVRMISIDEDWTALRFRRVEHIKKMTRSFAITAEGQQKVAQSKRSNAKP